MFDNLFFSHGLTYAKAFAYQYVLTALVYGLSALVFSYLLDLIIYLLKRKPKNDYSAVKSDGSNGELYLDSDSRHLNENFTSTTKRRHGRKRIIIKILRVLSILVSWYALLTIVITPSILSGLGIIPVWSSCIITFLLFVIKYVGIIYDLSSHLPNKDCTNFWKRLVVTSSMYRIGLGCFGAFALAYSITLPLVTANTCLNFFNKGYGVQLEGFGVSTKLSRHVQLSTVCNEGEICHVYSTLPEDASTSIIINVHTGVDVSTIQIGYEAVGNVTEVSDEVAIGTLVTAKSFYIDMDEERGNRYMHSAYITGLTPNTLYAFEIYYNNQPQRAGQFRTLPSKNLERNFTIAAGGDSGTTDDAQDMTSVLGNYDLDTILIGGDLVYDNGIKACYYSMDLFLNFFEGLNTNAGRLIPLMVAVGNHDVGFNAFQGTEIDISENLFFNYFPQHSAKDENGTLLYQVPDLSDRLTYAYHVIGNTVHLTLDSGYLMPYDGVQVDFINNISTQYYDLVKFANFHVPMYPTCINPDDGDDPRTLSEPRQYWAPLFEKYNFSSIFENHMHLYKKTFPLMNGTASKDGRGVMYFGDGNWGISPDDCYSTPNGLNGNVTGILEAYSDARHVWLVNISNETLTHWAVNETNGMFDQIYNVSTSNYINPKPIDMDL